MQVPFVDLKGQIADLRSEFDAAIADCLDNTAFIQGKRVAAFEEEFATSLQAPFAIGCSSGTDAIYLALAALGVGPGDEVLLPTMTFIATAEAVVQAGATPVLVDIDPTTSNIDVDAAAAAITAKTRAIIAVHLYGRAANLAALRGLADKHELALIGDAAQAHGAQHGGRSADSWADVNCYSFYPGKNLGSFGDAGACTTSDEALALDMRMRRNHGRRDKYLHEFVGVNMRMDELQAAVLRVKLPHLSSWTARRRDAARYYDQALAGVAGLGLPPLGEAGESVWHLYVVEVEADRRDALMAHLRGAGVSCGVHYPIPLHRQPAFAYLGHDAGSMPVSETKAASILSLPMHERLSADQLAYVAETTRSFFG